MITDDVINEIYKKYKKPPKDRKQLNLDYFLSLLQPFHNIKVEGEEVILEDIDDFNPFRMFLLRSLNGILEFDRMIAFVFKNHILFLGKENNDLRVHMKPTKEPSFLDRLFGNDE